MAMPGRPGLGATRGNVVHALVLTGSMLGLLLSAAVQVSRV